MVTTPFATTGWGAPISRSWLVPSIVWMSLIVPASVSAEIHFKEVTAETGLTYKGPTFGASWGDIDGDGWPDLWVSNHHQNKPSLYLNRRDGTFVDIADRVIQVRPHADLHGAAWADFDNDGDQDLIALTGGGMGSSDPEQIKAWDSAMHDYLFVNSGGTMEDKAGHAGLDNVLGRGRTPLWFDANADGRLDLLMMNQPRADGRNPATIYRQNSDGFVASNPYFGLNTTISMWEKVFAKLRNFVELGSFGGTSNDFNGNTDFAQLTDISGDGLLDLLVYSRPLRVYTLESIPFHDITRKLSLPPTGAVRDAIVEDFDGDGYLDVFCLLDHGVYSQAVKTAPNAVRAAIVNAGKKPGELKLHTSGDLSFHLKANEGTELPPTVLGASSQAVDEARFTLNPDDPAVASPPKDTNNTATAIWYDKPQGTWTVRSGSHRLALEVKSTKPIDEPLLNDKRATVAPHSYALFLRRANGFDRMPPTNDLNPDSDCRSVAAGDFDNDGDLDVYLVCTDAVRNSPNILMENDGKGHFTALPGAGEASGSELGMGESVATADYDRDGFLDLFITNGLGDEFSEDGPHQLFHNTGNDNHWIEMDLEGVKSNRNGVGAIVTIETGGIRQIRIQGGGMHRIAQNHQRLHFGLGQVAAIGSITVRWPSGEVQKFANIPADRIVRIHEGAPDLL